MSFHEKSLWLMFVSLVAVFGWYFAAVLPAQERNVAAWQVGLFVGVVVLLVVVQIIGAVLIAVSGKLSGALEGRYQKDERDRLIGLEGSRNGGYVLASGVFCSLALAVFSQGNFGFTHLLLGFWVLAQLVEIGSQLFLYRRSA